MGDVNHWEYKDAFFANSAMISDLSRRQSKWMILHRTIPHPSIKLKIRNLLLGNVYDKRARLELIRMAKNITCLTLIANPDKLIERVGLREKRVNELRVEGRDSLVTHQRKIRDIRALIAAYSDIERVIPMYDKWFAFCEQMGVNQHYLVDVNAEPVLASMNSWGNFFPKMVNPTIE